MAQAKGTAAANTNLSLIDKVKIMYGAPANMNEAEEFAWLRNTFEEVYGAVVPFSDAEASAWQRKMWDEHYDENAKDTLTKFWVLLGRLEEETAEAYGESGEKYEALITETTSVKAKLKEIERNLHSPAVKEAMEPLRDVWVQYACGGRSVDGQSIQRDKPIDRAVIQAFWRTASFDL